MPRAQFSLKAMFWITAVVGLVLAIGVPMLETGRLMWANWRLERAASVKQAEAEQLGREKYELAEEPKE